MFERRYRHLSVSLYGAKLHMLFFKCLNAFLHNLTRIILDLIFVIYYISVIDYCFFLPAAAFSEPSLPLAALSLLALFEVGPPVLHVILLIYGKQAVGEHTVIYLCLCRSVHCKAFLDVLLLKIIEIHV